MTCRCGRTVDADELAALTTAIPTTAPEPARRSGTATLVGITVAVVALAVGGAFAWSVRRSSSLSPASQSEPADARPPRSDTPADTTPDAAAADRCCVGRRVAAWRPRVGR